MFGWCYNIIVDVEVRGGFDDAESSLAYVILHTLLRLGRLFGLYDVCLRLLVESYKYNSSSSQSIEKCATRILQTFG